jgi:transcription-repair coupling factor (superfamily II helicase)
MAELKGEAPAPEARTTLKLGADIRIPTGYIESERQRLRTYKRIASLESVGERRALVAELIDRFGPLPPPVQNLSYAALKAVAERLLVESIERRQGQVVLRFHPETRIRPERLVGLVRETRGAQLEPTGELRLPVDRSRPDWLEELRKQLQGLAGDG